MITRYHLIIVFDPRAKIYRTSLVSLRIVWVELAIVVIKQLLAILYRLGGLHQDNWTHLRYTYHCFDINFAVFGFWVSMIHEKPNRSIVFWIDCKVGHDVGAQDYLESILIDFFLPVFGHLTQRHHISWVSPYQLSFLDGSAGHQSIPFDLVDSCNCHRENQAILGVGVQYLLIRWVQTLQMLVIEGVYGEPLMKNIVHTVLLLVKMLLNILQCCFLAFFEEWLVGRRQKFSFLWKYAKNSIHWRWNWGWVSKTVIHQLANPTKVIFGPTSRVIGSIARRTVVGVTLQPHCASIPAAFLKIQAIETLRFVFQLEQSIFL